MYESSSSHLYMRNDHLNIVSDTIYTGYVLYVLPSTTVLAISASSTNSGIIFFAKSTKDSLLHFFSVSIETCGIVCGSKIPPSGANPVNTACSNVAFLIPPRVLQYFILDCHNRRTLYSRVKKTSDVVKTAVSKH